VLTDNSAPAAESTAAVNKGRFLADVVERMFLLIQFEILHYQCRMTIDKCIHSSAKIQ